MSKRQGKGPSYAIGFGKPPAATQFKKGTSGNPRGRPKGTRNFKTDVKSTLAAPVQVTRNGKPQKVSTQEAALLRLRELALSGRDSRSLDRLLGLAQTHNNEEEIGSTRLQASDVFLIELFRARVLAGAAPETGLTPSEVSDRMQDTSQSGEVASPMRTRPQRYRLKNRADGEEGIK